MNTKLFAVLVLAVAAVLFTVVPGYGQTNTTTATDTDKDVQPVAAVAAPAPPAKITDTDLAQILVQESPWSPLSAGQG